MARQTNPLEGLQTYPTYRIVPWAVELAVVAANDAGMFASSDDLYDLQHPFEPDRLAICECSPCRRYALAPLALRMELVPVDSRFSTFHQGALKRQCCSYPDCPPSLLRAEFVST